MASPVSQDTTFERDTETSGLPPIGNNEEVALSPESKKVLEACTVPIAPVQSKGPSTLISRPCSSGVDMAGFHFAKPKRQAAKYTARSQSRPAGLTTPQKNGLKNRQAGDVPEGSAIRPTNNGDWRGSDSRQNHGSGAEPEPKQPESNTVAHPNLTTETVQTQQGPQGRLNRRHEEHARGTEHQMDQEEPAQILEGQGEGERGHTIPSEAQVNKTPAPQPQMHNTNTRKGETKNHSPVESNKRNMGPLAQRPTSSAFRVTKPQNSTIRNVSQTPCNSDTNPTPASGHSEADLFYMLIHKLKRRDDVEAADAALKEQMKEGLHKAEEENRALAAKFKQAATRSSQQETEITHQRNLVNRWKLKFDKLRNILKGIGDDQETLRSDGQNMKNVQSSLHDEKQRIFEELKTISDLTATVKESSDRQRRQLSGVREEVISLEQAVSCADAKVTEKENALSRERNRIATLEGYIKRSSNVHQKQATSIQKRQIEAISKFDELSRCFEHGVENSRSVLKAEMDVLAKSLVEISGAINEGQSSGSAQLKQIEASIQGLYDQLNEHCGTVTKGLERSCDEQNSRESEMVARLRDIETAVCTAAKAADREAEVRDVNGKLQEKLNAMEVALDQSNIERETLKTNEAGLKEQIHELQAEAANHRSESEARSNGQNDTNSELQLQLEATSSALTEVSENVTAKENEIQSLRSELENIKASLENSEIVVAALESEKSLIEQSARGVEQRVREELTRASLKSKDQSRALFEQEQHRLRREKEAAEKHVQKIKEHLDATKHSLVEANRNLEQQGTRTTDQRKEIEEIKNGHLRSIGEMSDKISSLEEQLTGCTSEKGIIESQLDATRKENEELRLEVTKLQATAGDANQMDILQERFDMVQRECIEKDENFVVLKKEIEEAREEAKEMAEFQSIALERSAEMDQLKKKLQETQQMNMEVANRVEQKERDITLLTEKLETSGKQNGKALEPKGDIQNSEAQIQTLERRAQEAECWSAKAEDLLRTLDLIGAQDSLSSSWNTLETRLRQMVSHAERNQTLHTKGTGSLASESRHQRSFSHNRSVVSTPRMKRTSSRTSAQEYQKTELVYSQHKIRESISISPNKPKQLQSAKLIKKQTNPTAEPGTCIRPFSQVQENSNIQRQSSPLSQLTDLSSMFPNSPENGRNQSEAGHTWSTESSTHRNEENKQVQSRAKTTQQSTSDLQKKPLSEGRSQSAKNNSKSGVQDIKGFSDDLVPLKQRSTNAPIAVSSAKRKETERDIFGDEAKTYGRKKARFPDSKSSNIVSTSQCASQDADQSQARRVPPKGILKDTPVLSSSTREPSLTQTPTNKPNAKQGSMQRRSSRTSLAYFAGPAGQAATRSSGAVSTRRGSQTIEPPSNTNAMPQTRLKGRRRNKGDQYNDRFSQRTPQT